MVRMVAVDLDGTLMNSRGEMPSDFQDWVLAHPDIMTVIASGRQYYTLQDVFSKIQKEAVFLSENGAMIGKGNDLFHTDIIPDQKMIALTEKMNLIPDVRLIICGLQSAYLIGKKDGKMADAAVAFHRLIEIDSLKDILGRDKLIKMAIFCPLENAFDLYDVIRPLPEGLIPTISGKQWIDVMSDRVNKGIGLKIVMERYGIDREECMAFGDLLNDVEMLQTAGISFAMGNGCPEAKAVARYIADTNDRDGVMKILRNIEEY